MRDFYTINYILLLFSPFIHASFKQMKLIFNNKQSFDDVRVIPFTDDHNPSTPGKRYCGNIIIRINNGYLSTSRLGAVPIYVRGAF